MDKIPIRKTPKDQWHLATCEEKKGSWLNALTHLNNMGKFFIFSFNAFFLFLAMVHSSNKMETINIAQSPCTMLSSIGKIFCRGVCN